MKDIGGFRKEDEDLVSLLPEYIRISAKEFALDGIHVRADCDAGVHARAAFFSSNKLVKLVNFEFNNGDFFISIDNYDPSWDVKILLSRPLNHYWVGKVKNTSRKVSVVIPTRNQSLALNSTLISLLQQTVKPHEVVICDDYSDTPIITKNYEGKLPINYVRNPEIKGPAATRNNGIMKTSGDIILCLDSDMIACPDLIEQHVKYHEDSQHRSIIGGRRFITPLNVTEKDIGLINQEELEKRRVRSRRTGRFIESREEAYIITDNLFTEAYPWLYFSTCNVSFSRSAYENAGGFNEKFKGWGYEDNEFAFRLFKLDPDHRIIPNITATAYHQEHERDLKRMQEEAERNLLIFKESVLKYGRKKTQI